MYISAESSTDFLNYIFAFNISNESFTQFKFINTAMHISKVTYLSKNSQFLFYGEYNDQYVYAVQTSIESILDFEDITEDITQIFYIGNISQNQLTPTSSSNLTTDNRVINEGTSVSLVARTITINVDQYTDVVYYFDTPTDSGYFSLIENWNQTLSINITCSINGSVSLEHSIESYGNNSAPTWVTIDDVNNQLSLTVPEVSANTDYWFQIKTNQVSSSVYYYLVVNLTVLN